MARIPTQVHSSRSPTPAQHDSCSSCRHHVPAFKATLPHLTSSELQGTLDGIGIASFTTPWSSTHLASTPDNHVTLYWLRCLYQPVVCHGQPWFKLWTFLLNKTLGESAHGSNQTHTQIFEPGRIAWTCMPARTQPGSATSCSSPGQESAIIHFQTLAAETGWDDGALNSLFWQGLNQQLRSELVLRGEPAGLNALITTTIRLDSHLTSKPTSRRGWGYAPPPMRHRPHLVPRPRLLFPPTHAACQDSPLLPGAETLIAGRSVLLLQWLIQSRCVPKRGTSPGGTRRLVSLRHTVSGTLRFSLTVFIFSSPATVLILLNSVLSHISTTSFPVCHSTWWAIA